MQLFAILAWDTLGLGPARSSNGWTLMRSLVGRHRWSLLLVPLVAGLALAACGDERGAETEKVTVVTTISPLRNIIENVGGERVHVVGLVPEGADAHTFDPPPSAARRLADADLVVLNGLNLELPTLELARANAGDDVELLLLGDAVISPDDYVFDFSFPEDVGNPNPHVWTDPVLAQDYAALIQEALSRVDPEGGRYYAANLQRFRARAADLHAAFQQALATIPERNRKLLTYHDSFPYFGRRYGLEIIGAIEPSDFSEPSPREVAALIEQIREQRLPAIFGSEVFSSAVLDQIAAEAGAVQVATLRDDDLPGDAGDDENTYFAMMVQNVRTMTVALGGDAAALDGLEFGDTWIRERDLDAA